MEMQKRILKGAFKHLSQRSTRVELNLCALSDVKLKQQQTDSNE